MHTSFEDSSVLGKFNDDCKAIGRQIDAKAEELRAAYQEIDRLTQRNNKLLGALADCYDYFDSRADADCDQDGFAPNEEMKMLSALKELGL